MKKMSLNERIYYKKLNLQFAISHIRKYGIRAYYNYIHQDRLQAEELSTPPCNDGWF
jgi:hypothetical protein